MPEDKNQKKQRLSDFSNALSMATNGDTASIPDTNKPAITKKQKNNDFSSALQEAVKKKDDGGASSTPVQNSGEKLPPNSQNGTKTPATPSAEQADVIEDLLHKTGYVQPNLGPKTGLQDYFKTGVNGFTTDPAPKNASTVKEEIFSDPNKAKQFTADVKRYFEKKINSQTYYPSGAGGTGAPILTDQGKQIEKERQAALKQISEKTALLMGSVTPITTTYLDGNGKTFEKTVYVPNEKMPPPPIPGANPDAKMKIWEAEKRGIEMMKIINPQQYSQVITGQAPSLNQQAQYMGLYAEGLYLNDQLKKKVKDPAETKALQNYIAGKASQEEISMIDKTGSRKIVDDLLEKGKLAEEVSHANPNIRAGFLKKAVFNELNNRFGASKGFLGMQGWSDKDFAEVISDYKRKLPDPRDISILNDILENKQVGALANSNQSWAAKAAGQFYNTIFSTLRYFDEDVIKTGIPNLIDPANADNRNTEQLLKRLKESDAKKTDVSIDFTPDNKQFFLKEYIDSNPESPTFLKMVKNTGQMDGNFWTKVGYTAAGQAGQLGAQIAMASVIPTVGRMTGEGFITGLDNVGAAAAGFEASTGYETAKAINFFNKVAVPAFAMTYDSNYQQSFDVVGTKTPWKNALYSTLTSSFEGATELLGNPLAQAKFFSSSLKRDIGSFVKNLSLEELQKMGATEFQDKLKTVLKESFKGIAKGAAEAVGESNEEALNEILVGVTQEVFNPKYTNKSNVITQAGQTWLQTFAGMGFMPAAGAVGGPVKTGWGSKLSQDALVFLATNYQDAIDNLNQAVAENTTSREEADKKIHLINVAAQALEETKKAAFLQSITSGNRISPADFAGVTMARTNEIELDNQIETAKKKKDTMLELLLEDKKKQYVEFRQAIINDKMWVDPVTGTPGVPEMPDEPTPTSQDTEENTEQPSHEAEIVPEQQQTEKPPISPLPLVLNVEEKKDWAALSLEEKRKLAIRNLPEDTGGIDDEKEIAEIADKNAKFLLARMRGEDISRPIELSIETPEDKQRAEEEKKKQEQQQQPSPEQITPPEANAPNTVPKITKVKGQSKETEAVFTNLKKTANTWLDAENSRLRSLFGTIPFKDFQKEYDTVKDAYIKQIQEAVKISGDITGETQIENNGQINEAETKTEGRQDVLNEEGDASGSPTFKGLRDDDFASKYFSPEEYKQWSDLEVSDKDAAKKMVSEKKKSLSEKPKEEKPKAVPDILSYDELPDNVKEIVDKHSKDNDTTDFNNELQKAGYVVETDMAFDEDGNWGFRKIDTSGSDIISSNNDVLKSNNIQGKLLDQKGSDALQKEIEDNYVDGTDFLKPNNDIRRNLFNYDEPIASKTVNGVDVRIAEGLIRDKKKTYLLYADGKIVGEFASVEGAKKVVDYIEKNLIKGIAEKSEETTPAEKPETSLAKVIPLNKQEPESKGGISLSQAIPLKGKPADFAAGDYIKYTLAFNKGDGAGYVKKILGNGNYIIEKNGEDVVVDPTEDKVLYYPKRDNYKNQENETDTTEQTPTGETEQSGSDTRPGNSKEKIKTFKKRKKSEIRSPLFLKALNVDSEDPHTQVLQYFIRGGKITDAVIQQLFGNKRGKSIQGEINSRIQYRNRTGASSIDDLAHKLWDNSSNEIQNKYTTYDFREAVEQVISEYISLTKMAEEVLRTSNEHLSGEDAAAEKWYADTYDNIPFESGVTHSEMDDAIDMLAGMSDEEIQSILDNESDDAYIQAFLSQQGIEPEPAVVDNTIPPDNELQQKQINQVESALKSAKLALNTATKKLATAEDKFAKKQAQQGKGNLPLEPKDASGNVTQKDIFANDAADVKNNLEPLRKKVKEARTRVELLDRQLSNLKNYGGPELFQVESPNKYTENAKPTNGSTESLISSGETLISETETAKSQEDIDAAVEAIEEKIEAVVSKIGKLTEIYSTEGVDHERPSVVIGKKAKKEIAKYAKEIAKINGWTIPAKNGVYDNIAPAGGDVVFRFDIPNTDYQMYAAVEYQPEYGSLEYDNYTFNGVFYRLETLKPEKGKSQYVGANQRQMQNLSAKEMAELLRSELHKYYKPLSILVTGGRSAVIPNKEEEQKKALEEIHDLFEGKKTERKVRDEKINNDIDQAWDDLFKGDNLLTSSGLDPKKIEAAGKLLSLYFKAGIYKFSDIVSDAYHKYGDKLKEVYNELKAAYEDVFNSADTDMQAKMELPQKPKIRVIVGNNNNDNDTGKRNTTEPQVEQDTSGLAPNGTQGNVQGDVTGGESEMGSNESGESAEDGGQPDGERNATEPGRGDSAGRFNLPVNGNEKLDEELGGTSEERPIDKPEEQSPVVSQSTYNGNFLIPPDFVNQKSFSIDQKIQDNINALKVLTDLNNQGRKATYEEQKLLFKYVGWGGIKEIGFNPDSDGGWSNSNRHLKSKVQEAIDAIRALDEENFKENFDSIKSSVLNAHYTSIPIIRGIWDVLRISGFTGGVVTEPSAGIGNFIGAMPIDFMQNSAIGAIELDKVTGQILKHLYPSVTSKIQGYEKTIIAPGSIDLSISNIPFGTYAIIDDNFTKSRDKALINSLSKIHSYFFARAIQDAKPNGIIAFLTSTGIMDSPSNSDLRDMIAERTEFMGAIRLPNDTFKGNANTQVTTDIIFLRKFGEDEDKVQKHNFRGNKTKSAEHKNNNGTSFNVAYNVYFHNNPQMVLGKVQSGSMYGASKDGETDAMTVASTGIDLEERIKELGKVIFPEKISRETKITRQEVLNFVENNGQRPGNIVKISTGKYGVFTDAPAISEELSEKARSLGLDPLDIRNDNLYSEDYDKLKRAGLSTADFKKNQVVEINIYKKYIEAVDDMIRLRDALNNVYASEYQDKSDAEIDRAKVMLKSAYDSFKKKHGTLHENKKFILQDSDGTNILTLETVDDNKVTGLADIFTKRIFSINKKATSAASISDAISINLSETGNVDIDRIAELLNTTPEEAIKLGEGLLFKNPQSGFETKDKYLSGNVRRKLEQAKIAAEEDKFYNQNVTALESVQPEPLNASQIYAPISAPWIDKKYIEDFATEIFNQKTVITKLATGRVSVSGYRGHSTEVSDVYGTPRMDGFELLSEAMQNRMPLVKDSIPLGEGRYKTVVNEQETANAIGKAEKIKEAFNNWIFKDDDRRNTIVNYYNYNFNNTVLPKYDGSHLTFNGYAGIHTPAQHQVDGVWMISQQMGGILDHIVGSGKTLLMVLSANKLKQMGLIKKPIILALKANAAEIAHTYQKAFPLAKVLYPKANDYTPQNRKYFFSKIANNDWDVIVMTHDQFGMVEQSREIREEIFQQEIDSLEDDIRRAKGENMSKRDINGLEERKKNLLVKLHKISSMAKDPTLKDFEQMGIDFMYIDESQQFKNLAYSTIQRGISGLGDPKGSQKSFNMLFAIRTLQKKWGGDKGIVFASGTPISNTMVEMFLLFKYLRPNKLAELGIDTFDKWANTFARVSSEIEFGVTNSLKPKTRMREFMNVPEMAAMYREIADVRNDSNLSLKKPKFKQAVRVKASVEIQNGETVTIDGHPFKVLGRLKGLEKGEYWISMMSVGPDVKLPKNGNITYKDSEHPYTDTEYSDGLLVNVTPSKQQRKYAKALQQFAKTKDGKYIGRTLSEKEEKAYMLLATNLASKMALDMRLISPSYPDSETGKIAVAADTIASHYKESESRKGIQLVFSDLGTPKSGNKAENLFDLLESRGVDRDSLEEIFGAGAFSETAKYPKIPAIKEKIMSVLEYTEQDYEDAFDEAQLENFNVYQALKSKLIKRGVPANEIAFIHDYKTDIQKAALFADAKQGRIRVILGSTSKLGTGVNVQDKIVAMHHLDVPWRPSDMEQRNGRGIRQGNDIIRDFYNNQLPIYFYATERTLDAYKYQLLATKQQFINQAKTTDGLAREISEGDGDEENGVSFAAFTASISGNPAILEKAKIDKKVKELKSSKASFEQEKYSLKDKMQWIRRWGIEKREEDIESANKILNIFKENTEKTDKGEWVYKTTIGDSVFTDRKEAGKEMQKVGKHELFQFLQKHAAIINKENQTNFPPTEEKKIGEVSGFDLKVLTGIRNLIDGPYFYFRLTDKKTGAIIGETNSEDEVYLGSFPFRSVLAYEKEIEKDKARINSSQNEIAEKQAYLDSLPSEWPKQQEYDEAIKRQEHIAAALKEDSVSDSNLPSKEDLQSIGDMMTNKKEVYDKVVDMEDNEEEPKTLYAITPDGEILHITNQGNYIEAVTKKATFYNYDIDNIGDNISDADISSGALVAGDPDNVNGYINAAKATLNILYPEATFEPYETNNEYVAAGGQKGTRGFAKMRNNGQHRILLNLEEIRRANSGKTAVHEVIHPIVYDAFGVKNEQLVPIWNKLYDSMQGVPGMEKVLQHVQNYSGSKIAVEGITELLTQVVTGNIDISNVPRTTANKIIALINHLFEILGIKYRISDINDFGTIARKVKDVFEGTSDAIKNVINTGNITNYLTALELADADQGKPRIRVSVGNPEGDEKAIGEEIMNSLMVDIPGASKIKEYLSSGTILKHTGEIPTNPQDYIATELEPAFVEGMNIVETAKKVFGTDRYVQKLLEYLSSSRKNVASKALVYVSLANDLYIAKKSNPADYERITKLQYLVNRESQALAHEASVALNLRRLQNILKYGVNTDYIPDGLFTPTELEYRDELEEAVQQSDDAVNNEYEAEMDEQPEEPAATQPEEQVTKPTTSKDNRRKTPKSQWKTEGDNMKLLNEKMNDLISKISKLDC